MQQYQSGSARVEAQRWIAPNLDVPRSHRTADCPVLLSGPLWADGAHGSPGFGGNCRQTHGASSFPPASASPISMKSPYLSSERWSIMEKALRGTTTPLCCGVDALPLWPDESATGYSTTKVYGPRLTSQGLRETARFLLVLDTTDNTTRPSALLLQQSCCSPPGFFLAQGEPTDRNHIGVPERVLLVQSSV